MLKHGKSCADIRSSKKYMFPKMSGHACKHDQSERLMSRHGGQVSEHKAS
jgi:hypothetical protein